METPSNLDALDYSPYPYLALPTPTSIRLLEVLPRSENRHDHIACTIKVVDINDMPKYSALSYTWGSPFTVCSNGSEKSIPVQCNIICDDYYVNVTENCHSFLLHVQKVREKVTRTECYAEIPHSSLNAQFLFGPEDVKCFWIDAICINQNSNVERSAQVKIMNQIYRRAQCVIVWLGPEDSFSRSALTTLASLVRLSAEKMKAVKDYGPLDKGAYVKLGIPYIDAQKWHALHAFLNRSWFTRAWVAQEIALSRKAFVLCGLLIIPWFGLAGGAGSVVTAGWSRAFLEISTLPSSSSEVVEFLCNGHTKSESYQQLKQNPFMRTLLEKDESAFSDDGVKEMAAAVNGMAEQKLQTNAIRAVMILATLRSIQGDGMKPTTEEQMPSLQTVLCVTSEMVCSRSEDRIYANLGLASPRSWQGLTIDYSRPVQETFLQATWAMIRSSNSLSILSSVVGKRWKTVKNLPSWVPDFNAGRRHVELDWDDDLSSLENKPRHFDAANGLKWKINLQGQSMHLLAVEGIPIDTIDLLCAFDVLDFSNIQPLSNVVAGNSPDLLWRTLINDESDGCHPAHSDSLYLFWGLIETRLFTLHSEMMNIGRGLPARIDAFRDADEKFQVAHAACMNLPGAELLNPNMLEQHNRARDSYIAISSSAQHGVVYLGPQDDPLQPYRMLSISLNFDRMEAELPRYLNFSRKLSEAILGRSLFCTSNGTLGKGPESAVKGDEIWILAGGRVPYVLRPLGKDEYEFVGEAYIHGIMYGEAVKSDVQLREIALR